MQINIPLYENNSEYMRLCEIDSNIREEAKASPDMWRRDWRFKRNLYKKKLGLENVSGPFFPNYYLDGTEKVLKLPQ